MNIRQDSPLINLVANSGIADWWEVRLYKTIRLCPFFWQVLISLLLFPLRPLFHWRQDMFRKFRLSAIVFLWAGLHLYFWHLFTLVFYFGWNRIKVWEWSAYLHNPIEWIMFGLFQIEVMIVFVILCAIVVITIVLVSALIAANLGLLQERTQRHVAVEGETMARAVQQTPWPPLQFLREMVALCLCYLKAQKEKLCPIIEVQR